MKTQHYFFSILIASLFFFSCTNEKNAAAESTGTEHAADVEAHGQSLVDDDMSDKNILQVAISSRDHTTLVAGVQATHLENVLANNGPLTVFAPTNAAFDKLPKGTLETLLKDENLHQLKSIITFHAAPGTYQGKLLKDGMKLFMATGHYVLVENKDGVIKVNGSKILATIKASNGVVHVVDDVFLPPED